MNLALLSSRAAARWRSLAAFLTVLVGVLLTHSAAATHIVGGQLRMKYLQPGNYNLGLTLYFDDVNGSTGAIDPSAVLAIYEKTTNVRMDTFRIYLLNQQPIAYSVPSCQISSLKTSQLNYTDDVALNPARYSSPRGYYMVWERCCRNYIITNIVRPESMGQTFYLEFPALTRNGQPFVNSAPEAFEPVRDYACVNTPFRTSFGGVDPDGDSLVYDVVTPLRGNSDTSQQLIRPVPPRPAPYRRIIWNPGFDSLSEINGPEPLTINRRTGEIAFTAGQPGLYVFAIRCTEYRNGVRIGELRREFQEKVVNCPPNLPPSVNLTQLGALGQAGPYVPGTVITLPDAPASRCLNVLAADNESNSQLTFSVIAPDAAPGAILPSLSVAGGTVNPNGRRDTLVAQLCFDDCFGIDGQELRLAVIVSDRACPVPQRDTVWLTVQALAVPDFPPVLTFADPATAAGYTVKPGEQLAFDFTGTDSDPNTRVTVRGLTLDVPPLAGHVTCPRHTADATATTRLTWDVDCATPPGDYALRLQTVSDACGRSLSADTVVLVRVLPPDTSQVIPPNIITPNADGLNDEFQPAAGLRPACHEEFRKLRIFSRWGREIFSSNDRMAIWRAENTTAGMYFYFLEYSNRTYKGWVEVIR